MKLLTPTENTTEKDKQLVVNIKKLSNLDSQLKIKGQELEKIKLEYEITTQKQLIKFEEEKEVYKKILNELKSEISNLEVKRKELLLPLDEKWKELEAVESSLRDRQIELINNTQITNKLQEDLEERLTEVSEREEDARILNQKQKIAQQGIDKQKEQIILQNKTLNESIIQTNSDFQERQQILTFKETELNLKEIELKTKEKELLAKEQQQKDKDKEIADKYATLQRTLERYGSKA